ncbi:MAG: aspartate kinase [Candidatus Scalindua sp. AMX11]|nr:MAG: aspartate kinase [Candidatus Scalindua sp.]NOG85008.1 aspartate kinase [Planctomycetota bacterium]RZV93064.1 MAG: aspartate kinase [Candidatus Scalindua sp. SCAELEC01]TDE66687.1 MAG: aspartate kinase [Candidatus Scalindua sp. AMX11]GJQ57992.1 MAG: aspartokinase [Candidatus Scalindua sp.]
MQLIVQKFGGTSVADTARIKMAAKRATNTFSNGNKVVVVVSARGKTTDELLALAYEIDKRPSTRELDMLLSTGEQISCALMAIAIHSLGFPAVSFSGRQIGITTDSSHTKARIVNMDANRITTELSRNKIVVIAGYQGVDENDNITTLGRGGSDTTAVAIAALLKADMCDIFTDVDGIYTSDPRIVPEARKLTQISYDEILELASLGAQVLNVRSIEVAKKYNVPLRVRPSFNDGPGTLICREVGEMEKIVVSGATVTKNEAKITLTGIPDRPGSAAKIFQELAEAKINVDVIIQNVSSNGLADVTFTVLKDDLTLALETAERIKNKICATSITADDKIAKLSIVGIGMRSHSGIAEDLFRTLADEEINIQMISTSEIKISCVIDEECADRALIAVHKAFKLDQA